MTRNIESVTALANSSGCKGRSFFSRVPYTTAVAAIAAFLLAWGTAGLPSFAFAQASPTIGLIGDSLLAATHANEMCGAGNELPDCFDERLGQHDLDWSHGGGVQSWSLAHRLGYSPSQTANVAEDGARWEDAFGQAVRLDSRMVDTVFINLGSNDVCQGFGHNYAGDLNNIARHVDDTLSHLLAILPSGGRIYWSGVPDIVGFRNVMANRRNNYVFRSCQAAWDLDPNEITEEAGASMCHDAGFPGGVCTQLSDWQKVRDRLMTRLLSYYRDRYKLEEGPCGRVLRSANTPDDLLNAQQFNRSLNDLLARKATQYNGRNGIKIVFRNILYNTPIEPNFVSHLDCFHPNRAGQMKMAEVLWKAFAPTQAGSYAVWYDAFDDDNGCAQELGLPWASCWYDYGDSGFDISVDEKGWFKVQKDTSKQRRHYVVREVGNLSLMSSAWMSFNHKRENLDDGNDLVNFYVYNNGVWNLLDRFQGGGNDLGEHAGKYYDLTPYLSRDLRIMFDTENQGSMKDGDRVKFDNISIFAWGDPAP